MDEICSELLQQIIDTRSLEVHYQPVVSVIKKSIIGLEGLSRGRITKSQELIYPADLFNQADKDSCTIDLDRLCREEVMQGFLDVHGKNKDFLLFLNIDGSTMTEEVVGSGMIINLVNKLNLKPENIVLEIVESKVNDIESLTKFIENYREYGFLIALDDVGSGHSNLDRIIIAKPDIIKIDRVIVRDIHLDYYKQEVFKSLVSLSKALGALVVAEGIECEEEAIKVTELGADMLQGYYIAKPQQVSTQMTRKINQSVRKLANSYSKYLAEKVSSQKSKHKEYRDEIKDLLKDVSGYEEERFDFRLFELINTHKIFECIYILDPNGIQVTDTVTHFAALPKYKNMMFQPAKKGEDHSLKKYYYFLRNMKLSKYITEPYISLATGNLCITMSCVFKNIEEKKFILCVDLNPDYL